MRNLIFATVGAATLALTACTSGSAAPPPTTEPSPSGPPSGGIAVSSINELRDAVEDAGVSCDDYFLRELVGAEGVVDFANCNDSVTFGVFDSQSAAETWAQSLEDITDGDSTMLIGDRWAMNVGDEDADQLQEALGGTVT